VDRTEVSEAGNINRMSKQEIEMLLHERFGDDAPELIRITGAERGPGGY
jgi:hypothetical protein